MDCSDGCIRKVMHKMEKQVKLPVTSRHQTAQNGFAVYVVDHVRHTVKVDSNIHASLFSALNSSKKMLLAIKKAKIVEIENGSEVYQLVDNGGNCIASAYVRLVDVSEVVNSEDL